MSPWFDGCPQLGMALSESGRNAAVSDWHHQRYLLRTYSLASFIGLGIGLARKLEGESEDFLLTLLSSETLMKNLWQDLRYGARMLLKQPGFTFIAVLTLALGIGLNTAIFSVVDAVVWRPLAFKQPDRLVMLWTNLTQGGFLNSMRADSWLEWRNQSQLFAQVEAHSQKNFILTGGVEPVEVSACAISPGMLPMLGVSPQLGRALQPSDAEPGNDRVAVISHQLWLRHFGGAQDAVGQSITLDDQRWTVVGVMPQGFAFPRQRIQLWVPLSIQPRTEAELRARVDAVARLRDGVSLSAAQTGMQAVAQQLNQAKPRRNGWAASAHQLDEQRVNRGPRRALLMLFGAVCFVLLIACANAANLLLARVATRERELVVRAALGAGRFRLMQQLLAESLLLALLGGATGVLLALWSVELIARFTPKEITFLMVGDIGVSGRVLWFTLGISLFTGLVCGMLPAWRVARLDLNQLLKSVSRGLTGDHRQNRTRRALVIAEVALSVVLLIGAGLMIRSFVRLTQVPPGYDPHNLLALTLSLSSPRYAEPNVRGDFQTQLAERLRAVPGVESVSVADGIPPQGGGFSFSVELEIEGRAPQKHPEELLPFNDVESNYFQTMRTPLVQGRAFDASDALAAPSVVILNDRMARYYWPDGVAVGKRFRFGTERPWLTVVGVAADVKSMGLSDANGTMELYYPRTQDKDPNESATFIIRTTVPPAALMDSLRQQVFALDRSLPIGSLDTAGKLLDESLAEPQFYLLLMALFAGCAILLAAVGLYGVLSYLVTQRTSEIGLRMALGAQTRDVLRLVLQQGMTLALLGTVIGIAVAAALTRWLKSLLFEVSATDPLTYAAIAVLLCGVALLACWIPARRAAKVDPMIALRCE